MEEGVIKDIKILDGKMAKLMVLEHEADRVKYQVLGAQVEGFGDEIFILSVDQFEVKKDAGDE